MARHRLSAGRFQNRSGISLARAGELRVALAQEGRHALLAVALAGVPHRQAVGAVRLDRVVLAGVAVEQPLGHRRARPASGVRRSCGPGRSAAVEQLVGLVHRAQQPALERLLGGEDVGGVDPLQRLLEPDDAGQEPRRRGLRHDAEPAEDEADAGLGRGHPDVHRQRHRGADADGRAVDRRDHRLGQLVDREGHLAAGVAHAGLERLLGQPLAQVLRAWGAADSSSPKTLPSAERSMPAQNARPAPVTTTARTSSSVASVRKTCSSSRGHRHGERVERVGPVRG